MEDNRKKNTNVQSLLSIAYGVGISNRLFTEVVQHYFNMTHTDIWANSISILSCSIPLGRSVYIYTDMRFSSSNFRNKTYNSIELSDNFLGGYEYLQLAHDTFANNTPVRVLLHNYYSAVLSNISTPSFI